MNITFEFTHPELGTLSPVHGDDSNRQTTHLILVQSNNVSQCSCKVYEFEVTDEVGRDWSFAYVVEPGELEYSNPPPCSLGRSRDRSI